MHTIMQMETFMILVLHFHCDLCSALRLEKAPRDGAAKDAGEVRTLTSKGMARILPVSGST